MRCMLAERNPAILENLRFALNVLQESSHLGLDGQYTARLQAVIQGQIARGEQALQRHPAHAASAQARTVGTERINRS